MTLSVFTWIPPGIPRLRGACRSIDRWPVPTGCVHMSGRSRSRYLAENIGRPAVLIRASAQPELEGSARWKIATRHRQWTSPVRRRGPRAPRSDRKTLRPGIHRGTFPSPDAWRECPRCEALHIRRSSMEDKLLDVLSTTFPFLSEPFASEERLRGGFVASAG